jgi:hypothetical protein
MNKTAKLSILLVLLFTVATGNDLPTENKDAPVDNAIATGTEADDSTRFLQFYIQGPGGPCTDMARCDIHRYGTCLICMDYDVKRSPGIAGFCEYDCTVCPEKCNF